MFARGRAPDLIDLRICVDRLAEIALAVAALLGIKGEDVKSVEDQVDLMVERRVSVARRAKGSGS